VIEVVQVQDLKVEASDAELGGTVAEVVDKAAE
jgi:hypothetical protein